MRRTSRLRRLRTASSFLLFLRSSLRSFARSQPDCTNVSLPSGRTSVIVACKSTLRLEERTHARTAPAPSTTVSPFSGGLVYETAVPFGFGAHLYGGVAVHSPPSPPAVSPVKFVSGRACGFQRKRSAPLRARFAPSAPCRLKYQRRAFVPGTGKAEKDCSKPGYGWPGWPPAPLSNRTRTGGCCSKAASAPS